MDTSVLESLIVQNNELLLHVYTAQLFGFAIVGAVAVLLLLYNFLRKFY